MKDKTRLEYLDAAKGLGILLVILGHIYAWNPNINRKILVTWIYSFFTIFLITMNIISAKNNACKNQVSTPIRINVQITSLIKALSSYPYNKILTKALHRLKTI